MEGGGDDPALAAPEVALADQQAVAQSPFENLAGEVPFDVVLVVGDEDVLDEIGFIEENKVVKEKPCFAEVGGEGVAGVHGQLVVAQQTEELDRPDWLSQRFGYNARCVGDCGVNYLHRRANSIWTAGACRSSVWPRFRGTLPMEFRHRTAINLDLEAVGEVAASLNRYEFLLTAAPLPTRGTGSPINPIATF